MKVKKAVLAYSGGLDTSVIIKWLKETYDCEIIAFCADLGQGEDLRAIKSKAIRTGASKAYVTDLREEFARDYVFPMLRANAVYEGAYLMGTSIARPLIAKKQIEIAEKEKADAMEEIELMRKEVQQMKDALANATIKETPKKRGRPRVTT